MNQDSSKFNNAKVSSFTVYAGGQDRSVHVCICVCVYTIACHYTYQFIIHTHDLIVLPLPNLIMEGFLASDSIFYFFIEHAINLQ